MRAEFTENLVTGNPTIDGQHKELIEKINRLLEAIEDNGGQATAMRTLNFLNDYVIFHFNAEEKLQEEVGYPGLEEHRKQHDILRKTVDDMTDMIDEEGPSDAFVEQLNHNIIKWLYKHIEGYDRSVAEYIFLTENPNRL